MDFGALMPEINSGRMYAGPGSGPTLAAAAAWDGLAAQLHSTAASYDSIISGLTAAWRGPSASMMAAAAAPYAAWVSTTAAQAERTANQARAAAAAYEAAFAATVPPPVIAANRAQLLALIATNILGQNTPAIMANEAQYAEMWAQDAAAMYGYAGSSATAAQVTPFSQAPQITNPTGPAEQAAAVAQATGATIGTNAQTTLPQLISAMPQSLQSLATPAAADPPSLLSELNMLLTGPLGPTSLYGIGGSPYLLGIESYLVPQNGVNLASAQERFDRDQSKLGPLGGGLSSGTRVVGSTGMGGAGVSAVMDRAGSVGGLSVPQSWASAAPAIRPVAVVMPSSLEAVPAALAADGEGSLFSNMALSSLAGRAVVGTGDSDRPVAAGGAALGQSATTATIIVIPADDADE